MNAEVLQAVAAVLHLARVRRQALRAVLVRIRVQAHRAARVHQARQVRQALVHQVRTDLQV